MSKRYAFIVSDRTGITAENLGLSLLCHFPTVEFNIVSLNEDYCFTVFITISNNKNHDGNTNKNNNNNNNGSAKHYFHCGMLKLKREYLFISL